MRQGFRKQECSKECIVGEKKEGPGTVGNVIDGGKSKIVTILGTFTKRQILVSILYVR